jgi:hypothetical protein
MEQIITLLKLILDILITLLTYVRDGLEAALRMVVQLIESIF